MIFHRDVEIVISHFNEDLFDIWRTADRLGFRKRIYSKGKPPKLYPYTKLSNIGREGHTYLYHIVNNYESLAEITIFCLGSAFTHDDKKKMFITQVKRALNLHGLENVCEYSYKEKTANKKCKIFSLPIYEERHLSQAHPNEMISWYKKHGPENSVIRNCIESRGMLCVRRENILQHPKIVYLKLLEQLSAEGELEAGHYMERLWNSLLYLDIPQPVSLSASNIVYIVFDNVDSKTPIKVNGDVRILMQNAYSNAWKINLLGQGQKWKGFGQRIKEYYKLIIDNPFLENAQLVITDGSDVLVRRSPEYFYSILTTNFTQNIIFSAERMCCVPALYNIDKSEKCTEPLHCLTQFEELFRKLSPKCEPHNIFLNAGMFTGKGKDLKQMFEFCFENLQMIDDSDDQSIFAQYMLFYQDKYEDLPKIELDYYSKLFFNTAYDPGIRAAGLNGRDYGAVTFQKTDATFIQFPGHFGKKSYEDFLHPNLNPIEVFETKPSLFRYVHRFILVVLVIIIGVCIVKKITKTSRLSS